MPAAKALDLLQGTLDVLVLRTLAWGPMHGYAVSRWIHQRTDGVLEIEDAPLYKALHRLERAGHVAGEWGLSENNRRARYYRLTAAGRRALASESNAWRQYAAAVFKVLEPAP
jgi:PadR family transcriptional regulator PadR